ARPTAEQHRAACETLLQHVERVAAVLRAAVAGEVAPEQGRQQIAALQPDGDAAVQQRKRLGAADSPEVVAVYSELEPRRRRAFEEFNQLCLRLTGKNALLTAAQGQVFAAIEALVAKPR
ncbi:MAG: hypothetical protein KDE27_24095, partial [Planctomycetes bacterium]|nr:hypothetical protein [Planctomycetota bacterium]